STNYSNAAQQDVLVNTSDVPSSDYVEVDGNKFPVITQQENFASQSISYGDQLNNNRSSSLSLGLTIPILNGFTAKHRVELARIDLANATAVAQTTKIRLRQEIEQAYLNMTTAYDRFQTLS